jgi:hydroxyquinol 1,2-dioxygenase
MGPFYIINAPEFPGGADISGGAEGQPLYVEITVASANGRPLADAIVDVWQSDDDGYYDVQRPDGNTRLRARFRTDSNGRLIFWSILPSSYPIPDDGPVGDMLKATKRHPFRPAHVHFMITAPAHETLVTHVFVDGDHYLNSDPVFGVKDSLVMKFEQHGPSRAPDGRSMAGPWRSLRYDFALKPSAR